MKNFKKIIALITSVMMLSSVSVFAEIPEDGTAITSIGRDTAVEYILTSTVGDTVEPGESFDVSIKVGAKDSTDYVGIGPLNFGIEYSSSLFDVAVSASQPSKKGDCSFEDENEDDIYWAARSTWEYIVPAKVSQIKGNLIANYQNTDVKHYVSTENTFLTFTFTVKADAPATKDVTLSLSQCESSSTDKAIVNENGTVTGTITFDIAGEEPEEEKVEVVPGENGKFTISYPGEETGALAGQTLVKAELDGRALTSATRFAVTYDGELKTFGATMWKELGFAGDEGTVEANDITVAVAFNFDVDTSKLTIARQN